MPLAVARVKGIFRAFPLLADVGGVEDQHVPTGGVADSGLRAVASRSHLDPATKAWLDERGITELRSTGSSLKFCMIAEAEADVYPRLAPTMEWDTAAAHAIVNQVGIKVLQKGSAGELMYNKENLLNPSFLCR